MTEIDLNRIRLRIWERSMRAMYECVCGPALDEDRAAVVAKLPDDVRRLLRKVFRTLYTLEPSELNLDRYLSEDKTFVQDLAHYSVKFLRNQVAHENLFATEDLAALPKSWSLWNQRGVSLLQRELVRIRRWGARNCGHRLLKMVPVFHVGYLEI